MEKVSIIIPIYNAQNYLQECIDSILAQSYQDIELLLIDNMSTDGSLAICKKYEQTDSRVKVYQETQKGAACARNTGIKMATGKYVTFVDSDDYVDKDIYTKTVGLMQQSNADMCCFAFNYVDENGNKLGWYEPNLKRYVKKSRCVSGQAACRIFLTSKDIEGFGWNKIFRRKLLDNNALLMDEERVVYHDIPFVFKCLANAKQVVLCPEKLYSYRQVDSSLVHANNSQRTAEFLDTVRLIKSMAQNMGYIKEADVYKAMRVTYIAYECHKLNNFDNQVWQLIRDYHTSDIVRNLRLILSEQKSEKVKTCVKMLITQMAKN